jgi:MFS family permease
MALARKGIEGMARVGYAARGLVYVVVGGLAVLAAIGSGGRTTDSEGALGALLAQPFGWFILAFVTLGLLGFAAWRLITAVFDPDDAGRSAKGLAKRAVWAGSAAVNLGLALSAFGLLMGAAASSGHGTGDWTAWLMSQPLGQWLVGLIGIGVMVGGVAMFVTAWRASFLKHLRCPSTWADGCKRLGQFGYAARGVTFLIIGGLLVTAAVNYDPEATEGLGGALGRLQQQPYGWVLLGVVALGLFAFGAFGLVQARYRVIEPPDRSDMPKVPGI